MYKININEQYLILCLSSELSEIRKEYPEAITVFFQGRKRQFYPYIDSMEKFRNNQKYIIHTEDFKNMYRHFKSIFKIIKAAGGIVRNDDNQILFIFRRGHWDLAKGKIDRGEKKKAAAIREVKEETGIENLELLDKVGKTFHVYRDKANRRCLKLTHWYRMNSNDIELDPQCEEGIEIVQWDNIQSVLSYTDPIYSNIKDILNLEQKMPIQKKVSSTNIR